MMVEIKHVTNSGPPREQTVEVPPTNNEQAEHQPGVVKTNETKKKNHEEPKKPQVSVSHPLSNVLVLLMLFVPLTAPLLYDRLLPVWSSIIILFIGAALLLYYFAIAVINFLRSTAPEPPRDPKQWRKIIAVLAWLLMVGCVAAIMNVLNHYCFILIYKREPGVVENIANWFWFTAWITFGTASWIRKKIEEIYNETP